MATQASHVQMPAVHIHDPSQVNVTVQQQTVAAGGAHAGEVQYKYDVLKQSMPGVSIFLQPIAAPSALGFAAFALATWVVSTFYMNWYGGYETPLFIAPFVLMMGLSQMMAAFWCYPARDATGTVFHATWGALWAAWGIVYIMTAQRFFPGLTSAGPEKFGNNDEFAMWLVSCAAITLCVALVTITRDILISSVALLQTVGAILVFSGFFSNQEGDKVADSIKAGGYFMAFAAIVALIRSTVYCLPLINQDEYTDVISSKKHRGQPRVAIPIGEPGVRRGQ